MSIYVLYHANCNDGFCAAYTAWQVFKDRASYIPVNYGEPLPEIQDKSEVYILDFSYKRDVLIELAKRVKKLVVLDHHKTAQEELEGLEFATFDMDKSGAVLAHEFFFPNCLLPTLHSYVQDRDLWQWKLESSKEISAYISLIDKTFEAWGGLESKLWYGFCDVVGFGEILLKQKKHYVEMLANNAHMEEINVEGKVHKVIEVDSPILQSEVGHYVLEKYPEARFASMRYQSNDYKARYSLRSRGDFDVSEVAKLFGGGGHKAAAGFEIDINE